MPLAGLFKPEYLWRPAQIVRRLQRGLSPPKGERVLVRTPWGWPIEVSQHDDIGRSLIYLGIYDLVVSEVIWRLCEPGETALDLGANLGFMTALLAHRVGATGRVRSFEAHPEIEQELRANVARWRSAVAERVIEVFGVALSDHEGSVPLEIPPEFSHNRGISRVAPGGAGAPVTGTVLMVPCAPLDSFLEGLGPIGLAKMDVEGHEEAVLRGATGALASGSIRDWVFEHHGDYPSAVTGLFEAHGYTLYQLQKRFARPNLVPVQSPIKRPTWEAQSFLGTRDPARAIERMKAIGWRVLASSGGGASSGTRGPASG